MLLYCFPCMGDRGIKRHTEMQALETVLFAKSSGDAKRSNLRDFIL